MAFNRDFYLGDYLKTTPRLSPAGDEPLHVVVVPEVGGDHDFSPCAYIRLLLPLDFLRDLGVIRLTIASRHSVLDEKADLVLCQRTSNCNIAEAQAIITHCRSSGIPLFYDIDDNLLEIDPSHPEHGILANNAAIVRTFLDGASAVFCSTENLRQQIASSSPKAFVVPNAIDHRLITPRAQISAPADDRLGILYMGTQTHNEDFGLVSQALSRIASTFGNRVRIGIIGVTTSASLPRGVSRVPVPSLVGTSYPAFMSWLTSQSDWHIGLSPLLDTSFNAAKSAIKALDYMAMGAASVVSRVPAYESLPDEVVCKVGGSSTEWFEAIASLLRDEGRLRSMGQRGHELLVRSFTVEAQAAMRIDTLRRALELWEGRDETKGQKTPGGDGIEESAL